MGLEFSKTLGAFFGGPYNKRYSTLGSILGSLILGTTPYMLDVKILHNPKYLRTWE